MKVVIAGSRNITNRATLDAAIQRCPFTVKITEVVCGGALGVDLLGDQWAMRAGLPVRYFVVANEGKFEYSRLLNLRQRGGYTDPRYLYTGNFPGGTFENVTVASDWTRDGKGAGPIRNRAMAEYADAAIVVPLAGNRRGSDSMIAEMVRSGKPVFVWEVRHGE